jgi:hypothetical protein
MDMPMPPAKQVNAGQLIAHIDRRWDMRDQIRDKIHCTLPLLQERARQTHEMAVQLLMQKAGERDSTPSKTVR